MSGMSQYNAVFSHGWSFNIKTLTTLIRIVSGYFFLGGAVISDRAHLLVNMNVLYINEKRCDLFYLYFAIYLHIVYCEHVYC